MLKKLFFHSGVETMSASFGALILRVSVGLCMIVGHGWGKLMNFGKLSGSFGDPLGIGSNLSLIATIGTEVVAAAFLVIGVFTRWSAAALAFTMAVAAFVVHQSDGFDVKEKALLYLIPCLALVFLGGGKFSLDKLIRK